MTSSNSNLSKAFSGSRRKTCCARLAGCACHRPDSGTISIPGCFGSNFSQVQNQISYFGFNKCKELRCKIKCSENNFVLPLNNCKSRVSGRHFVIRTNEHLSCMSTNVVYLIPCSVCGFQYVGETGRAAGVRWAEHLAKIRKGDRSQLVYAHFNSDDAHKNVPLEKRLRFQIIEKVRTDDMPSVEPGLVRKRRVDREMFWVSALRTAAPLGLNDKLEGFGMRGMASVGGVDGYNMFRVENICSAPKIGSRGRRHLKKSRRVIDDLALRTFRDELLRLSQDCAARMENFVLSKSRRFLSRFVRSVYFGEIGRGMSYLVSSCVEYFRKIRPRKTIRPEFSWPVGFSHKILSDVNVSSIIGSSVVKDQLPAGLKDKFSIKIVFKYGKTIGGKILNYNEVLRDSGISSHDDILRMSCDCGSSPFRNSVFEHVITGDLAIIQDTKLRELCSFGAKFRENPFLDIDKIYKDTLKNFDYLKGKIAHKFDIPLACFKKWKHTFSEVLLKKLKVCSRQFSYRIPVLSDHSCMQELRKLKDRYVITVVDKAANNFAFTCKKFYFLKLASELGMDNPTPGNDTYFHEINSETQIVEKIKADLMKFRIVPKVSEAKLALLYQTPKFHKNPPKMRYIAGNVKTVTSQLDKIVANILKMCKSHFINLCRKSEDFSGKKYYFDVQTSMEVKDMFDKAVNVESISINDFSTLYTLFDHEHLLSNISWLLHKLSRNSNKRHIRIGNGNAWWVLGSSEGIVFSLEESLEMIDYLVKNSYIKAFGNIFRQGKGIIMGGKSSGWLSDCSLMVDEFKYVDNKIKNHLSSDADKLKFFRRYRDDCTSLNITNFLEIASDIYPPSLTLTQENDLPTKVNVLDMVAEIQEGKIISKVYCKTDFFPFSVISLPFLQSNLDNKICYNVFYGQVVRFQRLSSLRSDFEDRVKFLATILLNRNYRLSLLKKQFCRSVEKYSLEFQKWDIPSDLGNWFINIINTRS